MAHLLVVAPPAPIAPLPTLHLHAPRWLHGPPMAPARRRRAAASTPALVPPADRARFLAALQSAATAADAAEATGLTLAALLATRKRDRAFDARWQDVSDARLAELHDVMLARALATLRAPDSEKGLGHPDVKHSVAIAMWLSENRFPPRTARTADAKTTETSAARRQADSAAAVALVAAAERRLRDAEAALSSPGFPAPEAGHKGSAG